MSVAHVLWSVNLVELSLAICNFEWICSIDLAIFTNICSHNRTVSLCIVGLEDLFKSVGNSEEGHKFPAPSHLSKITMAWNNFKTEEKTSQRGEISSTVVGLPHSCHVFSVIVRHVVRKQISSGAIVVPNIEAF